jgi:hypothetical protein
VVFPVLCPTLCSIVHKFVNRGFGGSALYLAGYLDRKP